MQVKGLRNYFRENWLPKALLVGMSEDRFWESNPKTLKPYIEAFKQRSMKDDSDNWMLGQYIRLAIGSALDKKCKYPEKPMMQDMEDRRIIDGSNLSEDEQAIARMKIMKSLGWQGQ